MNRVVIGTRGSDLALWQAEFVRRSLEAEFSETGFEVKIIRTTGDDVVDVSLSKIGDKGLFTRQIEAELLAGTIDLAVHSLKDLQTEQPEGLVIGAVCKREKPNDVLISREGKTLDELPQGAKVATGSLRRRSQLLGYRTDLQVVDIRGNLNTRFRRFDESDLDAMILAYAGVERLGMGERISQLIPTDVLIPAVGQGSVAVEIRENDEDVAAIVSRLEDAETRACITAERALLRRLEGGCQVPIGAYASVEDETLTLDAIVGSLDGKRIFRETRSGQAGEPEQLGEYVAQALLDQGADAVLKESRAAAN
ncbi:MAG: hydroxymethylbilane synthase [Acidobacteria bacterium]|nr:hydroxymethylbilane synthase [Acidobacteriota bacterium]